MKQTFTKGLSGARGFLRFNRQTFCVLLMLLLPSFSLLSQVAGDLNSVQHSVTFNSQFNNVQVDPNPNVGLPTRKEIVLSYPSGGGNQQAAINAAEVGLDILVNILEEQGVDVPSEVVDIVDFVINGVGEFSNVQVEPHFGLEFSCDYGGYFEIKDVGNANINVNYPIQVTIDYPAENTIGCGHPFTIYTNYTVSPAANLGVTPPFCEMEIGPILRNIQIGIALGIVAEFCVGLQIPEIGCAGYNFDTGDDLLINISFQDILNTMGIPVTIPTEIDLPPLQIFCEDAFAPGANMTNLLGCNTSNGYATTVFSYMNDVLQALNGIGYDLGFVDFAVNHVTIHPVDLPTGVPNIPEVQGDFHKLPGDFLASSSQNDGKKLIANGTKENLADLEIDLISLLELADIPTGLSLGGDIFSIDLGDIAPRFRVDEHLNFEFNPVVHLQLDLGAPMAYQVEDPTLGIVSSGFGQIVNLLAGQQINATYPEALSDPVTVHNQYNLDGNFKSEMSHDNFYEVRIAALEVVAGGDEIFTGFEATVGKTAMPGNPLTLVDHEFNLQGFESIQLNPFVIDPEYPIIDVTDVTVEDVANLGEGERAVVYKVKIGNSGDVRLHDVIADFNLGLAYQTAEGLVVDCITSDNLTVNANYDGITDINLLDAGSVLEINQESTIEILMRVMPEISPIIPGGCFGTVDYYASAKAYGTSPIGTHVESNVYHCTGEVTGPEIIAQVDLGAAVIDQLTDFTVYGSTEVVFSKTSATSKGNAGSTKEVRFENSSLWSNESHTIVGDIHAGTLLKLLGTYTVLADYVQVGGNLVLNGNGTLTTYGALSEASSCVSTQVVPSVNFPAVTSQLGVVVPANQTMTINPGSFKKITLNTNSTLIMKSGTYFIDTWSFGGNNASVKYDLTSGPVVINVAKWQPLNRQGLKFVVHNNSGTPEQITYNYMGNQPANFHSTLLQGIIYAPISSIVFGNGSVLQGRCYADKVKFDVKSYYTDPTFLKPLNISPACQPAVGTYRSEDVFAQELDVVGTNASSLSFFPNPFRESATISMNLNADAMVSIVVYDMMGRFATQIPASMFSAGTQTMMLNTEELASGSYIMQITIGDDVITEKIVKTP